MPNYVLDNEKCLVFIPETIKRDPKGFSGRKIGKTPQELLLQTRPQAEHQGRCWGSGGFYEGRHEAALLQYLQGTYLVENKDLAALCQGMLNFCRSPCKGRGFEYEGFYSAAGIRGAGSLL